MSDVEKAVIEADRNATSRISEAALTTARHLMMNWQPVMVSITNDWTQYNLIVQRTDSIAQSENPPRIAPGRLLITALDWRASWHFGPNSHPNYVQEKMRGMSEWDATVVSLFVQAVHRLLNMTPTDLRRLSNDDFAELARMLDG